MLLFSSANAAINPYKNIFGIDVIGVTEIYYSLVILFSGLIITFASIYFGVKADKNGSFVKYILICSACGFAGNIAVFLWPNPYTYFLATCLLLPIFCVLNSLIFSYATVRRTAARESSRGDENALLRSTYSMGYVLTLGLIGVLALPKKELIFIWLFSGVMSLLIFAIYFKEQPSNEAFKSASASAPVSQVFNKANIFKLVGVSLIASMLFTLDATAPLILVNQAGGEYSSIGLFEAGIAIFEIFFIFFWSRVAQKRKVSSVIIWGALLFSLAMLLFSMTRNLVHIYFLIPLLALGAACLISIPIGFLQSLAKDRPGIGGSLLSISFFVSSSVSSVVYFLGTYFFDITRTISISVGVGLLGVIILFRSEKINNGKKHE
ncbi:MFS transporter [Jeongeupia naejangsanensis]|uniref:MFS transporter n=1 Tax=Jeongeupia naejangsanensis TaxID=613195 RepID=A0ABS2BLQ8_9NEIS|nr:MFS transporter [Jeongeupia naejangsanensis]MBM3116546.1 MFS transporter [Jeongeupia naejangsanensis]